MPCYGHVAPKTKWGRIITILYALIGIPLTFLYLSNMGNFMAKCFRLFYQKICCGLCIYRRQFGLRICCGKDDDDDDEASAKRGRRKTRIVLAAQYNRAFDDSVPAADKSPTDVEGQPPSSENENGFITAVESSEAEQADDASAPPSASQNADREADATVHADAASGDVSGAASNSVDVEDERGNVNALTNDNGTSADVNPSSPTGNHAPATGSLTGNEKSSSVTSKPAVEPALEMRSADQETATETEASDRSTLTDDVLTDNTSEPEVEKNRRTKRLPTHRRCRSMGAGSRRRRMFDDTESCDRAVNVHEDDLVAQPEPEIVTGNEADALSDAATNKERRKDEEEMIKEGSSVENKRVSDGQLRARDSRMLGSLVLDLDELGILKAPEVKQEEMQVTVPISICLIMIAGYISAGAMMFTVWEEWDYVTGSYFCFVTLSTIGFGDIVPGTGMKEWASGEKLIICALWLALGLSMLAMCFNLMAEEVKAKFEWCGRKLGLVNKEDTDE